MTQIGYTDNHYWWYWTGGNVQMGTAITMPSGGGFIDSIAAKFGGYYTNPTCHLVLWDAGLDILTYSPMFTAGSYGATNTLPWYQSGSGGIGALYARPYVAGGETLYVGFYATNNAVGTFTASGGESWYSHDTGSPGALYPRSQIGGVQKNLNILVNYTAGGTMHARRSGGWVHGPVKVRRSGGWSTGIVKVRRSGVWVVAQ